MIKRLGILSFLAGFLVSILVGCGGGGGGGGRITFNAIADWTNYGNPISGNSQKWSLYNANDSLVQTVAINRDVAGEQPAPIQNLSKGVYRVKVELFSSRDLGGSIVGIIEELITINGTTSYRAAVGTDPATVKVTPTSALFKAGLGRQFYAAAYNAAGKATFVAPGSFTWQTFGGVATVSPDGFVQGTSVGNGTVVATHVPTSLQGGATLTIEANNPTTSKWTVLVYMNAANDLYQFSDLNMNQIEKVAGNSDVRFVVQWKQSTDLFGGSSFNGTRRYLAKSDNSNSIASELIQNMGLNVDMGDKNTLLDFINWGKTFYPAQRYVLVIWNHGNGWRRGPGHDYPTRAVSYDDQTGNAIQTWELAQALGSNHFDILAWDASLMQMMEVAHEVKDHADYIVGSEESPPGEGYPYDLVFAPFRDNPDSATLALSKNFVDGTLLAYQGDSFAKITQSVIDTTQMVALKDQIDALALELIANQGSLGTLIPQVRSGAKSYSPTSGRVYRDLWDVCDRIQNGTGIGTLQTACANVKTAIGNTIKWEGHNANSNGSHGISIDFSSSAQFSGQAGVDYLNLRFANDTNWNEWLAIAP